MHWNVALFQTMKWLKSFAATEHVFASKSFGCYDIMQNGLFWKQVSIFDNIHYLTKLINAGKQTTQEKVFQLFIIEFR